MKKLLLIAALAAMSTPAFASKARLNSLANAEHLVDVQTAFNNPAHLTLLPDYATFETGPSNATYAGSPMNVPSATAQAEGGFTQSTGDAKWGVYLGRKSDFTNTVRTQLQFQTQQNPLELQYAMKGAINWGVALNYSASEQKSGTTPRKQAAYGVRLGAVADVWEGYAIIGLGSDATGNLAAAGLGLAADKDSKYKGTLGFKVGGAYKMDNIHAYVKYYQDGAKYESSVNTTADGLKLQQSQADLGVVDHNKIDGGEWFYGVAVQMFQSKRDGANAAFDSKTTATYLPFLLGLEYDAASWLALRTSVTQNVLIGSTKTEVTAGGETDTIANNTVAAVGLGLKMNKWTLDGSLETGTTGGLQLGDGTVGNKFSTNMALTYNF